MKQPQACRPLPLFPADWDWEKEFHSPGILLLQEKCKEINHLLSIKVEQACKWRTRFQTNKTLISRFRWKVIVSKYIDLGIVNQVENEPMILFVITTNLPHPPTKIRLCHYSWLVSAQYALRNIWSFEPCLCSQLLIVLFQASSMWTAAARAASPATWASWTRSPPSTGSRRTYRTSEVSTVDFWSRGVSYSDIFADESPNVSLRQKALF